MSRKNKKMSNFVNNQFDFVLCVTVLVLLAMGIIMILSASAPSALSTTGNSYTYVKKQFAFAIVGVVLMFIISKIDYRFYKKYYWPIYFASWIILLLVLVPGLGVSVKGATRWVNLGFTQFQPSELTKIGLIIFYAGYLSDHKSELTDFWKGFVKPLCFVLPPIAILFGVQNHLSVSLIIGIITVTMMVMAGCRIAHFGYTGILGLQLILTHGLMLKVPDIKWFKVYMLLVLVDFLGLDLERVSRNIYTFQNLIMISSLLY